MTETKVKKGRGGPRPGSGRIGNAEIEATRQDVQNARRQLLDKLPDAIGKIITALDHEHSLEHKHDCHWFDVKVAEMAMDRFIPRVQAMQVEVSQDEQPTVIFKLPRKVVKTPKENGRNRVRGNGKKPNRV